MINLYIIFDQSTPIYIQIIEEFKRLLAIGSISPGDKLPSQRDLAAKLHVNVNTVQRAYREMEQDGVVETLRGHGTFVCQNVDIENRIRAEMLDNQVSNFVSAMLALGCSEATIINLVKKQLSRGEIKEDGGK